MFRFALCRPRGVLYQRVTRFIFSDLDGSMVRCFLLISFGMAVFVQYDVWRAANKVVLRCGVRRVMGFFVNGLFLCLLEGMILSRFRDAYVIFYIL